MMRERPGGSFSSLNCSPWWKSTGGVERSTSNTKPGLGTGSFLLIAEVEGDLDAAAGAGGGGVGDGVGEAGQGIGGTDQPAQVGGLDQLKGQIEGASGLAVDDLGAVGVGAG